MHIALDIMASDYGPLVIAKGAVLALQELQDLEVTLVGDEAVVHAMMQDVGAIGPRLHMLNAPSFIPMDASPIEALRAFPEASMIHAVKMVAEGKADAIISAGSTGAQVAATTLILRTLPGVNRAGIATVLPSRTGKIIALDVGANVQAKPQHLYQYGWMGAQYASRVLGIENPRVALLSVGSEKGKGNPLIKQTHDLFEGKPVNFIGNVEGHEIFSGGTDVVVTDGFVGNILLKISEGMAETLFGIFRDSCKEAGVADSDGFKRAFGAVRSRIDWTEVGGAQLLGTKGVSVIAHGRSNEVAIRNAIFTAATAVRNGLNDSIVASLAVGAE